MGENEDRTTEPRSIEEENKQLKRAVEELTVLNDLASEIGASHDSEEIIRAIIRRSLRAVDAEQGVITLVDQQANQPMKTLVRTMAGETENEALHLKVGLLGWMFKYKRPLVMNDPKSDERFRGVKWDESTRSLLCAPLMTKSELKGVLTVYNKTSGDGFTEEDERLLSIIAGQSAQIIENARLYEEEKALLGMREEVRLASEIQLGLLPEKAPQFAGYDIAGVSFPAKVVGGDYFDFIPMGENRLAICLGDISGKGLPAAMLMANLQATIRGQTLLEPSPSECIGRSNTLLFRSTDPHKFATLFYGILDAADHQLRYTSAGHDPPFLLTSANESTRLEAGGVVLSFLEEFPYQEAAVSFSPGDTLVVYSDGITEAMNVRDELYGEERLAEVLSANVGESAAVLIEKILEDARGHAGEREQSDDMTVVVIKRNKG